MTVLDIPVPNSARAPEAESAGTGTGVVAHGGQPFTSAATRSTIRLERRDGYLIAALRGEISADAVNHLSDLVEALALPSSRLVLDMSRLYDLDEAAITQLAVLRDQLAAEAGGLWLTGLRPWVRRLFEHMCTRDAFRIRRAVGDAVAEMAAGQAQ